MFDNIKYVKELFMSPSVGPGTGGSGGGGAFGGGHQKEWKTQYNYYIELKCSGIDISLPLIKLTLNRTANKPYPIFCLEFLIDSQELIIMKKLLAKYDISLKMYIYGTRAAGGSTYKIYQTDLIFIGHMTRLSIDDIKINEQTTQNNYVPFGIMCIPKQIVKGLITKDVLALNNKKMNEFVKEIKELLDINIKPFHDTDNKSEIRQLVMPFLNGHRMMDYLHYWFGYYNAPMVYWWLEQIYQQRSESDSKPTLWVWNLNKKIQESNKNGDVELYVMSSSYEENKKEIEDTGKIERRDPYGNIMVKYLTMEATPLSYENETQGIIDAYDHYIVWHPHKELYSTFDKNIDEDIIKKYGIVDGKYNYEDAVNKIFKEKKDWVHKHTGFYPFIGEKEHTEILYDTFLSSKVSSLYKIKAYLYYTIDPDSLIPFTIWNVTNYVKSHKKLYGKFFLHSSNLEIVRNSVGEWEGVAEVQLARTNDKLE